MTGRLPRTLVVRGADPASHADLALMRVGGDGRRGATRQTTAPSRQAAAPAVARRVEAVVSPVEPLVRLGGLVGAPRLANVITGTSAEQKQAADLVESRILNHGADAARHVHELALAAPDATLQGNLSRAAVELLHANDELLEHHSVKPRVSGRRRRR